MRIAIGSDHAGFELKTFIGEFVRDMGYDVIDLGTYSTAPVDYPDYA
jgi:ribose 5-phosphate isomerase B